MPKYTTLLFDLDGTVADTDEMIVETMNILYDLYRGGRRTPIEEIYYFSGPPIYETLNKEFPGCDMEFMHSEFRRMGGEQKANAAGIRIEHKRAGEILCGCGCP